MSSKDKSFRIILADDHPVFRSGLANLIKNTEGLKPVAEADDGAHLIEILAKQKCDLVILDLSMPKLTGLEALAVIREKHPEVKIMVLTMHKEREFFRKALSKGIDGYLLKDDMLEDVLAAVHEVRNGLCIGALSDQARLIFP